MNSKIENVIKSLKREGVDTIGITMAKFAMEFKLKLNPEIIESELYITAVNEVLRLLELKSESSKPTKWVDVTTGKTHYANY